MLITQFFVIRIVSVALFIGVIGHSVIAMPATDYTTIDPIGEIVSRDLTFLNKEKSRVEQLCSNKYDCRKNWTHYEIELIRALQDYDLCEHWGMILKCEDLLEEDRIILKAALDAHQDFSEQNNKGGLPKKQCLPYKSGCPKLNFCLLRRSICERIEVSKLSALRNKSE